MAQLLPGSDSEHRWIRFACCRLGRLFRFLPGQAGYNKRRLKAAAPARLERHGGRTPHGVFTRIAQRLLALGAAIC